MLDLPDSIDLWIPYVPTLFFAGAAALAAGDLVRERRGARIGTIVLLGVALVSRVVSFLEPGLCPVAGAGGGLGVIALVLALHVLVSALADRRNPAKTFFVLAVIAVLDLLSRLLSTRGESFHPPAKERALGELHGGIVLIAYAAFLVAAVYGILFLLQYSVMKRRQLGFWFQRLPALAQLEARAIAAERIGLALLSLGLLIGFYSFWVFRGGVPYDDVKFVVAMLLWLWFAAGLTLRRMLHWHGARTMWLPALGVLLMAIVYSVGGGHPFWQGAP